MDADLWRMTLHGERVLRALREQHAVERRIADEWRILQPVFGQLKEMLDRQERERRALRVLAGGQP